ncbi:patatin-like phospholipase family protein [Calditrichota bacterium GD2]
MRQSLTLFFVLLLTLSGRSGLVFEQAYQFRNGQIVVETKGQIEKHPKVALVLSGGGARGVAHIGVLKALEKYKIPIDLIVGTSIGSVVGGLYASGYTTDEILKIMQSIRWDEIYQDRTQRTSLFVGQKGEQDRYLVNLRFKNGMPYIPVAISPGQRILMTLSDIILRARYQATSSFDCLKIPFRAVTTDLVSGKTVVLKDGNLAEAINASSSIPLLFVPIERDSMLLVDGGLRSNLPVNVARSEGADLVIAVDVTSPLRKKDEINAPWQIVDQATTIMAEMERQLERKNADVLIVPPVGLRRNDDYSNLDELVHTGYEEAKKHIPEIKALIKRRSHQSLQKFFIERIAFNQSTLEIEEAAKLLGMEKKWVALSDIINNLREQAATGNYQKIGVFADTLGDSLKVGVHVEPFPPIKAINIRGLQQKDEKTVRDLMFLHEGKPLNVALLKEDLKNITDLYREDGFSLMRIDSVCWDRKGQTLTIHINEGVIKEIEISGNTKIKDYVIAREFSRQKGRVFNWKNIAQAIQNVYSTQLFDRVTVDISGDGPDYRLLVRVKEKSSVVMRFGGKYDTDRRAQLYIEFGDEALLGMGIKSMFVGRFGTKDGKVGFKLRDDRIFTTYLTFDLQGYYTWQVNPITTPSGKGGSYREERRGVRFQVGQQLQRLGQFIIELRHENIKDVKEDGAFPYTQNINLRTFAIKAIADKRDRIDFATKGINNYWSWESGNKLVLGSTEPFTKILVNLEGYYTFRKRATWHVRTFFGVADRSTPFSENFRLGGMDEFYGLYKNEYFGRQLFLLSGEYRIKLPLESFLRDNFMFRNFYVSARYDLGGIWLDPQLVFSLEDFFTGIGGALGIDTVLGPLHFAIGHLTGGRTVGYISLGFNY